MSTFSEALGGFSNNTSASRTVKEPIEGNSLIRFLRSSFNDLSDRGSQALSTGANAFQTGIKGFAPSVQYWEDILSGKPGTMSRAIAPTANQISKNYDQAANQASMVRPRGGYASTLQAEMPFRKAADVNNLAMNLQPQAAQQLQGIAQQLATLGLNQQQIGTILQQLTVQGQLGVRGQDVQEHNAAMGMATGLGQSFMGMFQTPR